MDIDIGDPFYFFKNTAAIAAPAAPPPTTPKIATRPQPIPAPRKSANYSSAAVANGQQQITATAVATALRKPTTPAPKAPTPKPIDNNDDDNESQDESKYVDTLSKDELQEMLRALMQDRRRNRLNKRVRRNSFGRGVNAHHSRAIGRVRSSSPEKPSASVTAQVCQPRKMSKLRKTITALKHLSWPVVCIASGYIGHIHYYKQLAAYLVPIWATLEAYTELTQ